MFFRLLRKLDRLHGSHISGWCCHCLLVAIPHIESPIMPCYTALEVSFPFLCRSSLAPHLFVTWRRRMASSPLHLLSLNMFCWTWCADSRYKELFYYGLRRNTKSKASIHCSYAPQSSRCYDLDRVFVQGKDTRAITKHKPLANFERFLD